MRLEKYLSYTIEGMILDYELRMKNATAIGKVNDYNIYKEFIDNLKYIKDFKGEDIDEL